MRANYLLIEQFLPPPEREQLLRELRRSQEAAALVYGTSAGGRVDERIRKARLLEVSHELRDAVTARLRDAQQSLADHFGIALASFEEPKFLRYLTGDFFVAHQDGNTGLIRDDSMHRRVSVILFLNDSYQGGELLFHGKYPDFARHAVPATPGALVAFPSETTHEVTPVTDGERYTVVSWYR